VLDIGTITSGAVRAGERAHHVAPLHDLLELHERRP
jgi:hypothetical protein